MMLCEMLLQPLREMQVFMCCNSRLIFFHPSPYNLRIVESTLCFQLMVSTRWQTLSLPTPLELIWFRGLFFLWGCYKRVIVQGENDFYHDQFFGGHVFPSSCRGFQVFTLVGGRVSSSMCQHVMGNKRHNEFLHQCANMLWGTKGTRGFSFSILCTFYRQKVSMMLQQAYVISILKQVVAIGKGFSKLGIFSRGPPFFLFDMLFMTGGRSRT